MKISQVAAGVAALAVFAGVYWVARDPAPVSPATETPREGVPESEATDVAKGAAAPEAPVAITAASRPVPTDPRLAALLGVPGDALVEYKGGPDGRVILEIDNDPNSKAYRKPLREYGYVGGNLATVTVYKYLGTQVQVIRAVASYKPDGSVDEYRETTDYRKPD